jgi:hypothetical protein
MNTTQRWIIARIHAYQARGGGLATFGEDCNFHPTCSAYAREAVLRHGAIAGLRLAWQRLHRCTGRNRVVRLDDPRVPELLPRRHAWWRGLIGTR